MLFECQIVIKSLFNQAQRSMVRLIVIPFRENANETWREKIPKKKAMFLLQIYQKI